MIQEKTIDTLMQLASPLVACGVLPQNELNELKKVVKQDEQSEEVKFPRLVKVKEAAQYLGVTTKTINDYVNSGRLVRIKFGRRSSRITADSIRLLLQEAQE